MRNDKDLNYSLMTNADEKIDLEIFRQSGKTQQLGNSFDWGAGGRGAVGGNEP